MKSLPIEFNDKELTILLEVLHNELCNYSHGAPRELWDMRSRAESAQLKLLDPPELGCSDQLTKVYIEEEEEGSTLIFMGNKKSTKEVWDVLSVYHKYDFGIHLKMSEPYTPTPKYKTLEDFYEVSEYKWTKDEMEAENARKRSES